MPLGRRCFAVTRIRFSTAEPAARTSCLLFLVVGLMAQDGLPSFQNQIQPILASRCSACHSAKVSQGGLSLESRESVLAGGKSGPAVVPGRPTDSLLLTMVASGAMPKGGPKLTGAEVDAIRRWIESPDARGSQADESAKPPTVTQHDVIGPILGAKCFVCHGRRVQQAGLDLRTVASILKGGKSGPAIVSGKPEESLLIQKIAAQAMPPPKLQEQFSVRTVTSDELEKLKQWIAAGTPAGNDKPAHVDDATDPMIEAEDRKFWAFQSPVKPPVPQVRAGARVRNPIDAFLLQKLESRNLTFSDEAGRLPLLRRAYLDLTGLPPSPEDIENYLTDHRPDAYERMIDRLLDSPGYGERWARYWLEASGYTDSEGGNAGDSIRPHAFRYRDYVIRAFNADKPYNQFLLEQIAGDETFDYKTPTEYTPEQADRLIATGFLRQAPDSTHSTEQNYLPERFDVLANEIDILSSAVMGLTVGCARCHDHKFDPVPQRDYYRLSAVLQTAIDPYDWRIPNASVGGVGAKLDETILRLLPLRSARERQDVERINEPVRQRIDRLKKQLETKAAPFRQTILNDRLATLPDDVQRDLRAALDTPAESRSPIQQYLFKNFEATLTIEQKDIESRFEDFKKEAIEIRKEIKKEEDALIPAPSIRALFDMGGDPTPNYLLRRGDVRTPGEMVEPGVLSVLGASLTRYRVEPPPFQTGTSGRRLALARWLTQPNHPLTSRVMVNRMWQHHFGRGLVSSPGNFGRTGAAPSHPELLDWLATEFVRRDWSIKAMQRLILTSAAYRQSSQADAAKRQADPENKLLSRFPLQRLDGDALRDSILKIAGRLDPQTFGPAIRLDIRKDGEVVTKPSKHGHRRSIYLLVRRTEPVTMLDAFDAPQLTPNCLKRSQSTVSSQALEMFNNDLIRESARFLAGRIIDEVGADRRKQLERAYLKVLARPATPQELDAAEIAFPELTKAWTAHLQVEMAAEPTGSRAEWLALSAFCHTLFNSAEFLYVD